MPSAVLLFCSTTRLALVFVLLLPLSTGADVPRNGFRRLVLLSPYALGGNMDAPRLGYCLFFARTGFFIVLALSLLLGVVVFPRRSSLHISPSSWGIAATTTVMTLHIVDYCFPVEIPRRSHISGSVLALQPFVDSSFEPLSSCLVVRAPKGPLSSNPVPGCQLVGSS